jgi:hypothetical protein
VSRLPLEIEFVLTGAGWIDIRLSRDGARYDLEGLSYVTPVLDDVLAAAVDAVLGGQSSYAFFELEPGRIALVYERLYERATRYELTVREPLRGQAGKPPFDWLVVHRIALGDADEFGRAVLNGASELLKRHGSDGYAEAWASGGFPQRGLAALNAALNIDETPSERWHLHKA